MSGINKNGDEKSPFSIAYVTVTLYNDKYIMFNIWPNHIEGYFTAEFLIDSIQSVKRNVTNQLITDPIMRTAAHSYINAQTAFAKMLVNNAIDIGKHSLDSHSNFWFPKKD